MENQYEFEKLARLFSSSKKTISMLINRMHTENPEHINENLPGEMENLERFESDAKKIVRRHLEDKDHVITEEEIASIRIGMTPPLDETE